MEATATGVLAEMNHLSRDHRSLSCVYGGGLRGSMVFTTVCEAALLPVEATGVPLALAFELCMVSAMCMRRENGKISNNEATSSCRSHLESDRARKRTSSPKRCWKRKHVRR